MSAYVEYVQPGTRVWMKISNPDGSETLLGDDGRLTFQGYWVLGTATFLIFDQVDGTGKTTKLSQSYVANADEVRFMGPIKGPSI